MLKDQDVTIFVRILQVVCLSVLIWWSVFGVLVKQAKSASEKLPVDQLSLEVFPEPANLPSQATIALTVTDQTPITPLTNPNPGLFQPRYISGFGSDDTFTVFFEDRDNSSIISYNSTTTGPLGFSAVSTPTNIADTHFLVKDWPITISSTTYAYRAWASVGNNPQHHFYVSNNLTTWTLVSTFTIPNAPTFTNANGFVYYGFHDVVRLNGTYYAFGESNGGQTMMVSSTLGADDWTAFASVGGLQALDGPLQMPGPSGPTPTGSFFDLGNDQGYGKIHIPGNDTAIYLATNSAAKASLSPADLEAAFISPANWTWNDGSVGLPTTPILTETSNHNYREAWLVPDSLNNDWTIIYTARYTGGITALGYAGLSSTLPPPIGGATYFIDDAVSLTNLPSTVLAGSGLLIGAVALGLGIWVVRRKS